MSETVDKAGLDLTKPDIPGAMGLLREWFPEEASRLLTRDWNNVLKSLHVETAAKTSPAPDRDFALDIPSAIKEVIVDIFFAVAGMCGLQISAGRSKFTGRLLFASPSALLDIASGVQNFVEASGKPAQMASELLGILREMLDHGILRTLFTVFVEADILDLGVVILAHVLSWLAESAGGHAHAHDGDEGARADRGVGSFSSRAAVSALSDVELMEDCVHLVLLLKLKA